MTTARERLVQLSGVSGVSAAQHLKQIGGAIGIAAGALLVAYSGLPTGSAAEHLLADRGSGGLVGIRWQYAAEMQTRETRALTADTRVKSPLAEAKAVIPVASLIPDGNVGAQSITGAIAPIEANQPLPHVETAQAAIKLVATEKVEAYGTQTLETIQAAQEGQQSAQKALLRRQDDEAALMLILMELA